jgi:hypothetical protein
MISNDLKKLFQLAKKTGDNLIVYDSLAPENSFVILDVDSYEKLVDDNNKKKEEFKNIDDIEKKKDDKEKEENSSKNEGKQDLTEENLTDKINREISMCKSGNEVDFLSEEDKNKKPWNIPPSVKKKAKEIE